MENYFIKAQDYKEKNAAGEYTGEFGLHPNPPLYSTDNWPLWAATHLSLCTQEERYSESYWFKSTSDKCRIEPGLYKRHPISTDMNSHDNLLGNAISAHYTGQTEICHQLYDYGWKHFGCWNSETPGKWEPRAFLGRVPGVWAILKVVTGRNLLWSPLDVAHAAAGYIINKSEPVGETSGRCLLYLQSHILYGKNWVLDKAIDSWRVKMNELYPNGPKGLYTIFFGPTSVFTQQVGDKF
jgi:hypothetical protein